MREEWDSAVLWRAHREDWHRFESDVQLFEIPSVCAHISYRSIEMVALAIPWPTGCVPKAN